VAPATAVSLILSLGPAPLGTVPDVVGQPQASAEADIVAAQFAVGGIGARHDATAAFGVVLSQSPAAGSQATPGSAVDLVISLGRPPGTLDLDGDGYTGDGGDCNDSDAAINPGAIDVPGDGIDQNCNGADSIGGDTTPPTAAIASPADLAEVTMPTDIVGTATDDHFLRYTLTVAEVDSSATTTIGAGTTAVTGGVLGRLDPTLLENGLYRVRLVVEDVNGQRAVNERVYRVEGTGKVGHFRLSFTDLSVPVAGVPVTVTRTYDSRVRSARDFGFGWSLELKTGTYRHNRTPGEGWIIQDQPFLGGSLPCIGGSQETRSHLTEVRLSDRESYRFALEVTNGSLGITGACEGTASFRFVDGSRPGATLEILGSTGVIYLRGGDDVVLDMDAFLAGTSVAYNPARVRLTLPDGTQVDLERGAGVTRIADLNGRELLLTPQGLVHSSGRSIRFSRDASHRITRITDPRGESLDYGYDAAGDLTTFVDQAGHQTTFAYDTTHRLTEIRDALGRVSRSEYDADGRLVAVIDPTGNRTSFTHDLDTRTETITDRLGHQTVLEYDARGNVVRRVDPLGQVSIFTYDARDNRLTETDALGHTRSFTYDTRDNVVTVTDPLSHTTTFTYNARNRVLTVSDARGGVTEFAYDSRDNVVLEVDATGSRTTHTYDASGNRTSTTDPTGARWAFAYDAAGQVIRTTTPVGQVRDMARDANGNVTREARPTDVSGATEIATTTFTYDALNRRTRIINAGGAQHSISYTAAGQAATQTDAAGGVTTFSYDDQDRLVRTLYPDGTSDTASYDAEGRRTAITDRSGRTTQFAHDALGRRVTTTYADDASTQAVYDAAGRQTSAIDELGRVTTFTYDAAGRRTGTRDPLGVLTGLAYDQTGRVVSSTDGNGRITTFEYDAEGRPTRTIFADGTSAAGTYDAAGRLVSQTDPAGNVTRFEYDARGALTRVIDPLNHATSYAYNDLDKRVSQTDALGNVTRFAYDRLGRLIQTTLPLGQTETRAYDVAGRLIALRDFNGALTTYTYDAMFRMTGRTLPEGETHRFTFTPTGLIANLSDRTGTTTFSYDLRDRPTLARGPDGAEIRYAYDAAGHRTDVTTPGGSVAYGYDLAGRLTQVTDMEGRQSTFAYDAGGNLTTLAYPNGIEARYEYDGVNRLTDLTHRRGATTLRSFRYSLGPVGNRTRVVEDTGRTVDYAYDGLFRLTAETVSVPGQPPTSLVYSYDAAGNRVSQTGAAGTVTYVYDANSRLIQSGGQTFTYDANGNLLATQGAGGLTTYAYDGMHRLMRATVGGTTTESAYNALGHRVRTTDATGVTQYLIDPFGAQALSQVLRETTPTGAADYVRGGQTLLSMHRPTGTSFYLHDGHASTRMLADPAGVITDRYDYDSFGNVVARQGTTPNEFLFAGQRLDSQLGFYDLRARLYDPLAGRFTSRDPFAGNVFDPGSLHPYTYAHNDPVNRSDPSGQFTLLETMTVSASVGILAGYAYAAQNYYYYRSAELAFEVGVDAAFSYGSLAMDAVGAGALIRTVGKEIVLAVAKVMAGKTVVNQTGRNAGKSIAQRLTDQLENVLCRTNNIKKCGLEVVSVAEAEGKIAKSIAEESAQLELQEARALAREAAEQAATKKFLQQQGVKGAENVTATISEVRDVSVAATGGAVRTVVAWWMKKVKGFFSN
jgi:RHS repeat-associated protein